MNYAIETLQIEKYKLLDIIRTEEKYSVFPEYHYSKIEYKKQLMIIEKAIIVLKEYEG